MTGLVSKGDQILAAFSLPRARQAGAPKKGKGTPMQDARLDKEVVPVHFFLFIPLLGLDKGCSFFFSFSFSSLLVLHMLLVFTRSRGFFPGGASWASACVRRPPRRPPWKQPASGAFLPFPLLRPSVRPFGLATILCGQFSASASLPAHSIKTYFYDATASTVMT